MHASYFISNSYILLIISVHIIRHYRAVTSQIKSVLTKPIFAQQKKPAADLDAFTDSLTKLKYSMNAFTLQNDLL